MRTGISILLELQSVATLYHYNVDYRAAVVAELRSEAVVLYLAFLNNFDGGLIVELVVAPSSCSGALVNTRSTPIS